MVRRRFPRNGWGRSGRFNSIHNILFVPMFQAGAQQGAVWSEGSGSPWLKIELARVKQRVGYEAQQEDKE